MPHESTLEQEKTLFDVPAGLSLEETILRLQGKQKQEKENEAESQRTKQASTAADCKSSAATAGEPLVKPDVEQMTAAGQAISRKKSNVPHLFPEAPTAITHHHDTDEDDSSNESN